MNKEDVRRIIGCVLIGLAITGFAGSALADQGDRIENRLDARGDRVEIQARSQGRSR